MKMSYLLATCILALLSAAVYCNELHIGVLVSSEHKVKETAAQRIAAVNSVIDSINNDPQILGNYTLQAVVLQSEVSYNSMIKMLYRLLIL